MDDEILIEVKDGYLLNIRAFIQSKWASIVGIKDISVYINGNEATTKFFGHKKGYGVVKDADKIRISYWAQDKFDQWNEDINLMIINGKATIYNISK